MTTTILEQIQKRSKDFIEGNQPIKPGQPVAFSDACQIGDYIEQGDFYIELCKNPTKDEFIHTWRRENLNGTVEEFPIKYKKVQTNNTQLVPGNTLGSRHCLKSINDCEIWLPENWSYKEAYNEYYGPIIKAYKNIEIEHPVHGNVTILGGTSVCTFYQRSLDVETKKERRQLD